MKPQLRIGDVFCSANPWVVGKIIQLFEKFWAVDGRAEYGHAGIIISPKTRGTFEALRTAKRSSLDNYIGKPLLIVRPVKAHTNLGTGYVMLSQKKKAVVRLVNKHEGDIYPWWRLILHIIPPVARRVGTGGFLVCSELVAKYLHEIKVRPKPFRGVNPDTLADEFVNWKNYEVVFKGIWGEWEDEL